MDDRLDTAHRRQQRVAVAQIASNQLDRQILEQAQRAVGPPQGPHGIATRHQGPRDLAADKAGGTSAPGHAYEELHVTIVQRSIADIAAGVVLLSVLSNLFFSR